MPRSPYFRYASHDRPCVWCGGPIRELVRRDAGFCSNKCRQAAYRARKRDRARPIARG